MEYRQFGKTGLRVSVFTLGGMRFYRGWEPPHHHLPQSSKDNATHVIQAAFAAGINMIETARGYGKSERLIGAALRSLAPPRERYYIMTKAAPVPNAAEMRSCIDESLERLQVDKLDLFAFHGINQASDLEAVLQPNGALAGVEQARREGLVGAVGFSTHAQPPILLDILNSKAFDFVNLHYYLFRQANQAAVIRAGELGMGVMIISPNDQGGLLYTPPAALVQCTAPLHPVVCNERWLLDQTQIHTLSLGLSDPQHVALHLQSLAPQPNPALLAARTEETQRIVQHLTTVARTSRLHQCGVCTRCLPCPKGINIPELCRLLHLAQTFAMQDYGRYRYRIMQPGDVWAPGAEASTCDQCGDCLPRCPAKLPIPDLLATAHKTLHSWSKRLRRVRTVLLTMVRIVVNRWPALIVWRDKTRAVLQR